jgi:hypothetical protein
MKYRVTMSIVIEARDEREAHAHAMKLGELLESPMVRMAVQGQGIRLPSDVQAIVYQPQREI